MDKGAAHSDGPQTTPGAASAPSLGVLVNVALSSEVVAGLESSGSTSACMCRVYRALMVPLTGWFVTELGSMIMPAGRSFLAPRGPGAARDGGTFASGSLRGDIHDTLAVNSRA